MFSRSKLFIYISAAIVLIAILSHSFPGAAVEAQSVPNLSGQAWSSTIGWISFQGISQNGERYGVEVSGGGPIKNIRKQAWANPRDGAFEVDNIGWFSFEPSDVQVCVASHGGAQPKFDSNTGKVTGWVRVLSGASIDDGWDGCVSLAGVASDGKPYGVTVDSSCNWTGEAWGDEIVGWVSFSGTAKNGVDYGVKGTGDACRLSEFDYQMTPEKSVLDGSPGDSITNDIIIETIKGSADRVDIVEVVIVDSDGNPIPNTLIGRDFDPKFVMPVVPKRSKITLDIGSAAEEGTYKVTVKAKSQDEGIMREAYFDLNINAGSGEGFDFSLAPEFQTVEIETGASGQNRIYATLIAGAPENILFEKDDIKISDANGDEIGSASISRSYNRAKCLLDCQNVIDLNIASTLSTGKYKVEVVGVGEVSGEIRRTEFFINVVSTRICPTLSFNGPAKTMSFIIAGPGSPSRITQSAELRLEPNGFVGTVNLGLVLPAGLKERSHNFTPQELNSSGILTSTLTLTLNDQVPQLQYESEITVVASEGGSSGACQSELKIPVYVLDIRGPIEN